MLPSYIPVLLQREALMGVHTVLSKIKGKRSPHVLNSAGIFASMLLASLKSTKLCVSTKDQMISLFMY